MTTLHPLLRADPLYTSAPVSAADLTGAERALGIRFPEQYREFLLASDGYGGPVGGTGHDVYLWSTEEVVVDGYDGPSALGIVLIGTNGGPTGYGIARASGRYVSVPLASDDPSEIRSLGATFSDFLQAVANGDGW